MSKFPTHPASILQALAAKYRRLVCFFGMACMATCNVSAQPLDPACGNPWVNNTGPFDYRTEHGFNKKIVEDYHFAPKVEALISGQSAPVGGDIDYTLRAFPNHHRALIAMMNLAVRAKSNQPVGAQFTLECYFKRALAFRPDDQVARMLYSKFLAMAGRKAEAMRQLEYTAEKTADNALTQYNIGLLLLEMGEFEKATAQAHIAQQLGFEGKQLREKLQAAGKWSEPVAPPEVAARSASAPAGSGSSSTGGQTGR